MINKILYWIFQPGKACRYFCPACKYFDRCRLEVKAEQALEKVRKGR